MVSEVEAVRRYAMTRAEFSYDVFLTHSARDKAVVRPLAERLRQDGSGEFATPNSHSALPDPVRVQSPTCRLATRPTPDGHPAKLVLRQIGAGQAAIRCAI